MLIAWLWFAASVPTLGEVERLPPGAAGDLVLGSHPHESILTVKRPERGLLPPGHVELLMAERPVAVAKGCMRKHWRVNFHHDDGQSEANATVAGALASTEIALPLAHGCPVADYVHVNPGLDLTEAFAALRHLRLLQAGRRKVTFACSDSTPSGLCASSEQMPQRLAELTPRVVTRRDTDIALWLYAGDGWVTEVRYAPATPTMVTVERRIPAPF